MSKASLKIKLGCFPYSLQPEIQQLYQSIQCKIILKHQQIIKLEKEIGDKINKNKLPFLVMQGPNIPIFQAAYDQIKQSKETNRVQFVFCDTQAYAFMESNQIVDKNLIRKIEKAFLSTNKNQQQFFIKMSFYDFQTIHRKLKQGKEPISSIILNRFVMDLQFATDPDFIRLIKSMSNHISEIINKHPLFQVLEIVQDLNLVFQFDSFQDVDPKILFQLFGNAKFTEEIFGQSPLPLNFSDHIIVKQPINLYVSIGRLAIIHFSIPTRLLFLLIGCVNQQAKQ